MGNLEYISKSVYLRSYSVCLHKNLTAQLKDILRCEHHLRSSFWSLTYFGMQNVPSPFLAVFGLFCFCFLSYRTCTEIVRKFYRNCTEILLKFYQNSTTFNSPGKTFQAWMEDHSIFPEIASNFHISESSKAVYT